MPSRAVVQLYIKRGVAEPWNQGPARTDVYKRQRQLREAIDAFITVYNPQAVAFEWTKREVWSVEPKHKYAYLNN